MVILLPLPPLYLGLQVHAIMPNLFVEKGISLIFSVYLVLNLDPPISTSQVARSIETSHKVRLHL
jgi:hypothetical protein